jgi:hypothetical protein
MVGGRRVKASRAAVIAAQKKTRASSTAASVQDVGEVMHSIFESFLNPQDGTMMKEKEEVLVQQPREQAPPRTKMSKQQSRMERVQNPNRKMRATGNCGQPRSTGGNH